MVTYLKSNEKVTKSVKIIFHFVFFAIATVVFFRVGESLRNCRMLTLFEIIAHTYRCESGERGSRSSEPKKAIVSIACQEPRLCKLAKRKIPNLGSYVFLRTRASFTFSPDTTHTLPRPDPPPFFFSEILAS